LYDLYDIMQLSVRDVEDRTFKEFKAQAVKEGLTVGRALTLAMQYWIEEEEDKKSFLDLKPTDWGKGTEHSSEEIDAVLYGK